jgi:hypothetical protein
MLRMVELTDRAREALVAADVAARRLNPEARIRLAGHGTSVRAEFTDGSSPDDVRLDLDGLTLLVAAGLEGVIDVGEHNELTLQPGGPRP